MKVAVITGSRADWNGLGMVAKCLRNEFHVAVHVIAIGQHAETGFGEQSLSTIIDDGFDPIVAATNYREDMAHGLGRAVISIANALDSLTPDMALVLGDRFEILGAASAVALRGIPLAHIGGGDITEGSIDNKMRYAISSLADLHFVTNDKSGLNVGDISVGGIKVYTTGAPALDRIAITPVSSKESLFGQLGLQCSKHNILVAYHAVTNDLQPTDGCVLMLDAINALDDCSFLIIGTNADTGSAAITQMFRQFICAQRIGTRVLVDNLSPQLFYSALTHFDCMVGNSSAGIVETAGFGIPVINIGDRQKGRPQPHNVFDCEANSADIRKAVVIALGDRRHNASPNPYGDGHSAPRIAKIMDDEMKMRKLKLM